MSYETKTDILTRIAIALEQIAANTNGTNHLLRQIYLDEDSAIVQKLYEIGYEINRLRKLEEGLSVD